ncbi:hypothetical protein LCGC14_0813830 [marine sediment metagenome]|uniref:Uncharacterized protein n=1 Tax=marine sediment metagenome TaxID=412755 RepID=A0A0F9S5W0_9ZZZZ
MAEKTKPWAGAPRGPDWDVEEYWRDALQESCPHPMTRMSYEATWRDEFGARILETAEFACGRCGRVWTVEEFRRDFREEIDARRAAMGRDDG